MATHDLPAHARRVIIGAGPTGLGAARRFQELGESDWLILEKTGMPGGLAGSVRDDAGYTWDFGGHIQFSHYRYFDDLMDELLPPEDWIHHVRESWVWIEGRFVPYPFQNNLRYLSRESVWECVQGLMRLDAERHDGKHEGRPANFDAWARRMFGEGIYRLFMKPYNFKVWAWPLETMSHGWIGDRVSVVDLERVVGNILLERDDVSWGPNATFRFPRVGGTGEIWRRMAARLPEGRIALNCGVAAIDTARREVALEDGRRVGYETLVNTAPLDWLAGASDMAGEPGWAEAAAKLRHSTTHIVGLGVRGAPTDALATKRWMYFPEPDCPFYRVTVFSNYSPNNVPDIAAGWSLMCEVSESPAKPVDAARVVEECVQGAVNTKLVGSRKDIVHTFHARLPYGYPTPSLERDGALEFLLPRLEARGVYSRGRFGAWKYEVSNQDHSLMQGVELAERLIQGGEETTLLHPDLVNLGKKK